MNMSTSSSCSKPRRSPAPIETLPPELLFYLTRFVDLASLVILTTATSRRLQAIFGHFDRELLYLEPKHRFNLAEWREAAHQVYENVLNTPSIASDRARTNSAAENDKLLELTRDESLMEVRLFESVLWFLGWREFEDPRERKTTQKSRPVRQIECLHLSGWHGMGGMSLIYQLHSRYSLSNVSTIVKTERGDTHMWKQAVVDDQLYRNATSATYGEVQRIPSINDGSLHGLQGSAPLGSVIFRDLASEFERCTDTQFIVQVGRRVPRKPGQEYLHGEGLQMGYQGFCIDRVLVVDMYEMLPGAVSERTIDEMRKRLHVILIGRESPEAEDRGKNEELFERSIVTCNQCKQRIVF